MLDWMLMPLRRYADFSGRSRRKEYWSFVLGALIAYILVAIVDSALGLSGMVFGVYGPLTMILGFALIIPSVAVQVRRLHDQDRSGWWLLIVMLPFVGSIVLLVFMCLEGTRGDNRFGPDPKGASSAEVFG